MKYILGIDLGTSGVKCLILSEKGTVVDSKTAAYSPDFGADGFVQQDPVVWWENTKKCIKELVSVNKSISADIVALCTSGQMHSSVFLDR
jgi:xylulokinase